MSFSHDHFRRHVLRTSTETVGSVIWGEVIWFCQSEICNLDVPINSNKNILWFEVSVNNSFLMQVLKAQKNFNHVKSGSLFGHTFAFFYDTEHFPSWTVLKNEGKVVCSFKRELHFDYERMIDWFHDVSFIHDDFFFFMFENESLIDEFHGIKFSVFLEAAQKDFWKPAHSDAVVNVEWWNINLGAGYFLDGDEL